MLRPLLLVPVLPPLLVEPELEPELPEPEPELDEPEAINPLYRSSVAPFIEVDPLSKPNLAAYPDSPRRAEATFGATLARRPQRKLRHYRRPPSTNR